MYGCKEGNVNLFCAHFESYSFLVLAKPCLIYHPFILSAGFKPDDTEKCKKILGMQNGQIPDSSISASTMYNSYMGPENGRLHFQAKSGEYGAWAVASNSNNEFQWFQVDFGSFAKITGLSTQGRQDGSWWVKTYSVSFSYEGVFFENYKENNITKVSKVLRIVLATATTNSITSNPSIEVLPCQLMLSLGSDVALG